jgi:hypothetical protein
MANSLPIKRYKDAPGGCPTWSSFEAKINSPQSQKLATGDIVFQKVIRAMANTPHPVQLLILL